MEKGSEQMYKKIIRGFAVFVVVAALAGLFYYMAYLKSHDGQMRGTLVNTFQVKVNEELV